MDNDLRKRLRRADDLPPARPQPPLRPVSPRPIIRSQTPPPQTVVEPPAPIPPLRPVMEKPPTKPRKKRSKKPLIIFIIVLLLLGAAFGGYKWRQSYLARKEQQKVNQAAKQLGEIKPTGTIRLIASGDNLTFDSVNNAAKKPNGSYDYDPLYAKLKPFFDKADIRVCNETVPAGGTVIGISGSPTFNAPAAFGKGLGDVGCNVINMATNHINDKGQAAITPTVGFWDNQSSILAVAGANRSADDQNKIHYFTVKQIKFAFLSYTTSSNVAPSPAFSVNIYSDDLAQKQITEATKNAQFVIVNMNWGKEDSGDITPDQDRIAQNLANLGADIVIGSGPHVVQPAKILNGKNGHQSLVWFSLGNFLNSQIPIENLIGGIAVMDIDVATQHLTNPTFLPVYMHYEWTAEQKQKQDLQARHNLLLIPLDQATDLLPKSQSGTTVQAQTDRIKGIITKFAPIKVITSAEY